MQLPINIPELLKIATDLKEVSNTPLSVSVFIDDSAKDELISHVRSCFASAGAHTRVTISYLDDRGVLAHEQDDMAVIIAGESSAIGEDAENLRKQGIPCMVVADDFNATSIRAKASGYPIPEADIVVAEKLSKKNPLAEIPLVRDILERNAMGSVTEPQSTFVRSDASIEDVDDASLVKISSPKSDGIIFDDATFAILDNRMGEWILSACSDKKLAFALSFPFVRRPLANDSVTSTSLQNAAIGVVPLIPGADLPIMTLNQAKMVLQISTAYGQPLDASRVKEIAAVVAGGFLFRNIARSITKVIPVAGSIVGGAVGFAGTEAMGRAVIEYFEAGGDLVGVAKVVQTARDEVMDKTKKAASTPAGKRLIDMAKDGSAAVFTRLRSNG